MKNTGFPLEMETWSCEVTFSQRRLSEPPHFLFCDSMFILTNNPNHL